MVYDTPWNCDSYPRHYHFFGGCIFCCQKRHAAGDKRNYRPGYTVHREFFSPHAACRKTRYRIRLDHPHHLCSRRAPRGNPFDYSQSRGDYPLIQILLFLKNYLGLKKIRGNIYV